MITPAEITARAQRAYPTFLRTWLRGEPFTPLNFPAGNPPTDYHALQQAVAELLTNAQCYRVEQQTRATRSFGSQSLPVRIHIDQAADLLRLIGKTREFQALQADVALIRAQLPQLETWLEANLQRVIAHHGTWSELLAVCAYFLAHPRPNRYARELPIAVHTKFVEEHIGILRSLLDALLPPEAIAAAESQFAPRYGLRSDEPLVRLRLLDPALPPQLGWPVSDLSAPLSQIAALPLQQRTCVIVENKQVFLTLPALPNTLAIFGSGFAVDRLAALPWLATCAIWYWGDLDLQGFHILARLRSAFPAAQSLLMDEVTLGTFQPFVVPGTPSVVGELPQLTAAEQALAQHLAATNQRLEQERIAYAYACAQLAQAIG